MHHALHVTHTYFVQQKSTFLSLAKDCRMGIEVSGTLKGQSTSKRLPATAAPNSCNQRTSSRERPALHHKPWPLRKAGKMRKASTGLRAAWTCYGRALASQPWAPKQKRRPAGTIDKAFAGSLDQFPGGIPPKIFNPSLTAKVHDISNGKYAATYSGVSRTPLVSSEHIAKAGHRASRKHRRPDQRF
jgi:hypothetical protein